MKKLIALVLAVVCVLSMVGCNQKQEETNDEKHVFQAEIIEISNGTMLVKPLEGYSEAEYSEKISVDIQHMPASPEPEVGDIIEITYSGIMMEIYPPVPSGVEKIEVVKDIK